jgi:hypothetical protein
MHVYRVYIQELNNGGFFQWILHGNASTRVLSLKLTHCYVNHATFQLKGCTQNVPISSFYLLS